MQTHRNAHENCKKLFLSVAALTALAIPIALSTAHATPVQTQSQPVSANLSDFKFDAVSIKPNKSGTEAFGFGNAADAYSGKNISLEMIIHDAFGIYEQYRYSGTPGWISSDRYDVEAKLDSATADQLHKLNRNDRKLVTQHMLQLLLAERFNFQAHHETKEFSVYFLVTTKGGPKLQESKPNPDDPKAPTNAVWGGGGMRNGVITVTAKLMPLSQLAQRLSGELGRMVLDKTGLTGTYDFTLQYAFDRGAALPLSGVSEGQPVPSASDPNGVSIFTALQDQLGLKLESGKGPVEIIVIDHVERASGN